MAQGTGLPIPKSGNVVSQASSINADAVSSAAQWTKIAAAGASVADAALDTLSRDVHLQQAASIAEMENRKRVDGIEARDRFARDPEGFKTWAQGDIDGTISEVPPWMAAHAKSYLSRTYDTHYSAILSEKRSQDFARAGEALKARRQSADDDVMGLAAAGRIGTPEGNAAVAVHRSVLQTAVEAGTMAPEMADYLADDLAGRAQGEVAARNALAVYRERGFEAAVEYLRSEIRENDKLTLKPAQRDKAFNRGLSQIRLQQAQDRDERTGVVEVSKDIRQRLTSNQAVDPGEVAATLDALRRTGGAAEFHRLSVEWSVRQATEPYRQNLKLRDFASAVSGQRIAVQSANAQSAMQFFQERGWSPAQAAGIVGNLIQESGSLDPTRVHDQGTGIGIAGWRLERRTALRTFAASRGTSETDFQTQLEFLHRELQTTEARSAERLRGARTPAEAAEAFIHFERPAGYTAANPRGGHGFANRVRNAQMLAGEEPGPAESAGLPYAGEIAKRVQGEFVKQARGAWPQFKSMIDKGVGLDADDLTAIRYAAALSGDANWQREVEAAAVAQRVGTALAPLPAVERQAGLDAVTAELKDSGLPAIDQESVVGHLRKQLDRQARTARENPVGYYIERGAKPPPPLDLSAPQRAQAAASDRYAVARIVAAGEGIAPGNPFQPAERQALAAAIQGGTPEQRQAAFAALNAAPDDMLVPVLKDDTIKAAVSGAARSTDPGRFGAAMGALDQFYARAPEEVARLFGGDVFKTLQDWQAKLRYFGPAELADALKRRDDPQVHERMKANVEAGAKIAREKKPESLIGEWQSVFGLFGASPPADPRTRDAWMADYVNLYGERYAVSLDKATAHRQTVERMKHSWAPSAVNGGRLTLNGPERYYSPDSSGSHGWMRRDLLADIKSSTGREPSDHLAIADPATERDIAAGRPASYLVAVKNDATGEWDILRGADNRPRRYAWDTGKYRSDAREMFARQRQRIFEPQDLPSFGDFAVP